MKIAFFLFFFYSASVFSQNTLLKCLGKEEAELFKKRAQGSIMKLNQDLVLEFIQFSNFQPLKEEHFNDICENNEISPSFKLLEAIFLYKRNLFKNPNAIEVNDLILTAPSIFLTLVSQIRTHANDRACIDQVIPELNDFDQIVLSFQSEKSDRLLFYEHPMVMKVFRKLPVAFDQLKRCQEIQSKKEANALKKEEESSNSEPPKEILEEDTASGTSAPVNDPDPK